MTDLLISIAKIVDGTGRPAFLGDIAIKGAQISAVTGAGEGPEDAKKIIDAKGDLVTPGFVDIHTL